MTAVTVASSTAECATSPNKASPNKASHSTCTSGQSRHSGCPARLCKGQRRGRYNRRTGSFQHKAQVAHGDCAELIAKTTGTEAQAPSPQGHAPHASLQQETTSPQEPPPQASSQQAPLQQTSLPQESSQQAEEATSAAVGPEAEKQSNDKLMDGLSKVLTQWASQPGDQEEHTCFHSQRPPAMSVRDYVDRLRTYFFCSDTCFLVALTYIDRIIKRHPHIRVSLSSVHRLFLIGSVLAAKYNEDTYYSNDYYARVGGLRLKEVNNLEKYFLQLLDWKLLVQPEEYTMYCNLLIGAVEGKQ